MGKIEIESIACPRCRFQVRVGAADLDAGRVRCLECRRSFVIRRTPGGIVLDRTAEIVEEELLPLALPKGSIRALVALLLCGAVWASILRRAPVPEALRDVLFTVLAYYFARRSAGLASGPAPRQTSESTPLHLPRNSVRFLLIAGFAAVSFAILTSVDRGPLENLLLLALVGSFLVGQVLRWILPGGRGTLTALFVHGKALAALAAALAFGGAVIVGRGEVVPAKLAWACACAIGFYFGSR